MRLKVKRRNNLLPRLKDSYLTFGDLRKGKGKVKGNREK
jgi:hypothetical protein